MGIRAWCCLVLCAPFALASSAAAQTRWEIFVYVAADNDAEAARVADVVEMQAANNPNVDVLVQIDRATRTADDEPIIAGLDGYASGARRFRVTNGGVADAVEVGRVNSGSRAALDDFLAWAIQNQRFTATDGVATPIAHAVIISGPGSGWRGTAADTSTRSSTSLTAADIGAATNAAFAAAGRNSLYLVAIDGAYFSTVENLGRIARGMNGGGRIVAFEGTVDTTGFVYTSWLDGITLPASPGGADPSFVTAVAGSLVTTYASAADTAGTTDYVVGSFGAAWVTDTLNSRLVDFADFMVGDALTMHRPTFAAARAFSTNLSSVYQLVDARTLFGGAEAIGRSATRMRDALAPGATVEDSTFVSRGSGRTGTGGVSIYLPVKERIAGDPAPEVDGAYESGTSWATFVAAYATANAADSMPPMAMPVVADDAGGSGGGVDLPPGAGGGMPASIRLTSATVGSDIDAVRLLFGVPVDGGLAFLGELPLAQGGGDDGSEGGAIDYAWDGSWMGLTSPELPDVEPAALFVLDEYDDGGTPHVLFEVPVRFDTGLDDVDALEGGSLVFDVDLSTREGVFLGAFAADDSAEDTDGVVELPLDVDALVLPLVPVVSDDGDLTFEETGAALPAVDLGVGPFVVGDGVYEMGILVTDWVGNSDAAFTEVQIGTPAPPASSGGGCSASPTRGSLGGLVALALVGLAFARRRRVVLAAVTAAAIGGCGPGPSVTPDGGRPREDAGPCDDEDGDDVCDTVDGCWGFDDTADADGDDVPDGCDCDASGSACDTNATCEDGEDGVVCFCNEGFVGDGLDCMAESGGCGDDTVSGSEVCDGTDLGGESCTSLGFVSGTLGCTSDCSDFDRSRCETCGNATREAGEACDGSDFGGASCTSLGFVSGTLACAADCTVETSGCVTPPGCPDGSIGGGEDCDGSMLGGATCASLGFARGTLTCSGSCTFDTSACVPDYRVRLWMRERETGSFFFQPQTDRTTFGPSSAPIGWTADGARTYQPVFGDFDGDGNVDIGVREDQTGAFFIRYGDGAGAFAAAPTPTVSWTPDMPGATPRTYQAIAGDFDGDGRTDLGVRERETGSFYFRFATAARGFGPSSIEITWTADGAGGNTYLPFAGDFDGNGLAEIGVRESGTGSVFVRTNASVGTTVAFLPQLTPTLSWTADTASARYQPFAADFDVDGRADFGLRSTAAGTFSVRFQAPDGSFTVASTVLGWQPDGAIGGSPPGPRTYQPGATGP